ncbi:hypothetical protein JB92DRAFT_755780 [Gautieria morchelliformis]|nr:hypothetical protein JB92DRAFT_755780 [Gautieria morchelliformis]
MPIAIHPQPLIPALSMHAPTRVFPLSSCVPYVASPGVSVRYNPPHTRCKSGTQTGLASRGSWAAGIIATAHTRCSAEAPRPAPSREYSAVPCGAPASTRAPGGTRAAAPVQLSSVAPREGVCVGERCLGCVHAM